MNAPAQEAPADVEFNDLLLFHSDSVVDLSRFNKANVATPGEHRADLFANRTWLGRATITLGAGDKSAHDVRACFNRALLNQVGADLTSLPAEASDRFGDTVSPCVSIEELVPGASARFDNSEQRLDVEIPQRYLVREARGYVDPRHWDEGVTAALLSYNGNIYRTKTGRNSTDQAYLGLNSGLNLGPWRLRHAGNVTYDSAGGRTYQRIQTHLQRSIAPIRSRLVIGEAFTDGTMFDSTGFRGIQLASDERMYPQSQRGYAPTVHGVAKSNATVRVRQGGNIIYSTNVAAGPFEIDDLYPTGYGGDIDVEVVEADGSIHTFKVPFSSAVNALRPGITHYSITAGQYRNPLIHSKPLLFQATVQHGFTNLLTGYGGVTAARGYQAALAGAALNTRAGAFALDVTRAHTASPHGPRRQGQSVKLSFSKLISPTNTNIAVAAYRYSSSGYLSLPDAMQLHDRRPLDRYVGVARRGQLQLTLNQGLPLGWGSLYLSGSTISYWDRRSAETQYQAGYNNSFGRLNYGVSVSRQYDLTRSRWDNRLMLNLSIPISVGTRTAYASTSVTREGDGATLVQQSVSGSLGEDSAFSYGLNAGRSNGRHGSTSKNAGGNLSYRSPYAAVSASASKGTGFTQYGGSISGGLVAYSGGLAFTPTMGDTIAVIDAEGASGARVTAGSGLRVDPFGHALVSSLTPFARNEVELDPKGLPMSVELKSSTQHVAPTAGAVVRLKFETEGGGRSVIMRVRFSDGQPVPFGAQVNDAQGQNVGTVAQDGRVVLRSVKTDSGTLHAKWGDSAEKGCAMPYVLPASTDKGQQWVTTEAVCD